MISATNGNQSKKLAYSLKEIHELTGLSLPYLRMRAGNELRITRFGKQIRVLSEDLEAFLRNGAPSYRTKAAA